MTLGIALALAGAAIAIIIAAVGSTIGVGKISSASNGLLSKEPKYFSRLLILMLLPSSQSIYALTVAFMIFVRIGILPGAELQTITTDTGLAILFLCLPVAVIGGVSTIVQGNVGVTAVSMFAKQNKMFGSSILIISASEVFALFGFLISMLGVLFIDLEAVSVQVPQYIAGIQSVLYTIL
ncbi:MAG: permease [Firmicutes bacterium]|nr:permease [Bacillota bacterium]